MSGKTYKARVLVLRKTKLGEKDLIVSMLEESGMLVKGVAKGARKPGSSFSARLELFGEADVLMARGRSLDIVTDARIVGAAGESCWGLEQSACASPLAELLCNIAQPDLAQPRVFGISRAAFALMGDVRTSAESCLALCAASLWKVMAQIGFRPSLSTCISCGRDVDARADGHQLALSISEGGVTCSSCSRPADAIMVSANTIAWLKALLLSRFADITAWNAPLDALFDGLHLARQWARVHTGRDLKSLDFVFTSGLFA